MILISVRAWGARGANATPQALLGLLEEQKSPAVLQGKPLQ